MALINFLADTILAKDPPSLQSRELGCDPRESGAAGNFLLAASASPSVHAVNERLRPFTHQLSVSRIPGIVSAPVGDNGLHSPNSGA
jgi:hypothetical protein